MSLVDRSDDELIAAIVARDPAALEILYDRYAASAMGLAYQILRDRMAAEEILQEAFWRVWKSGNTFERRRGDFAAWFFGIVRNLAIDQVRRRTSRSSPVELDDGNQKSSEIADGSAEVIDQVWTKWQHKRVQEAIQQLPAAQRQVIELAFFQGMTRQEIAKKLGEPPGTIHTRARLALQKLRMLLGSLELRK